MTQEEKARRFDEVLAMAKDCITYIPDDAVNQYMLDMFPELKESEDERIMVAIICGMYALKNQNKTCFASIPIDNVIAWLEKLGEQNPAWSEEDASNLEFVIRQLRIIIDEKHLLL